MAGDILFSKMKNTNQLSMKDILKIIKFLEKEEVFAKMEEFTRANS